jgi:hypothetical protein
LRQREVVEGDGVQRHRLRARLAGLESVVEQEEYAVFPVVGQHALFEVGPQELFAELAGASGCNDFQRRPVDRLFGREGLAAKGAENIGQSVGEFLFALRIKGFGLQVEYG